jgi:hypothetical protein
VSRKLSRPSLKNYLSTGKVIIEGSHEACDTSKAEVDKGEKIIDEKAISPDKLLELFSPEDLNIWEPVFKAGAKINREKTDFVELRNFFRTMDRAKFTLYILENEKVKMRTVRSGVQIREPFILFLLWDDAGIASVYISDEKQFI